MKSFSSALILGAAGLAILSTAACGDDTENSSSGGGGGGSPTSSASTATSSPTTSTSSSDGGGTPSSSSSSSDGGAGPGPTSTGAGGEGAGGNEPVGEFDCSAPSGELPALTLTEFLSAPGTALQMRQAPGDNERFFVGMRNGVILIAKDGVFNETPFLDISDSVTTVNEQGLLGIAFHPDYQTNGRFFVHYSDKDTEETYVAEYQASDDPDVAEPTEIGRVIEAPPYESNHNGGAVEVGPDGYLYVSVGDGGEPGDPDCRGQDVSLRAGKILRADISVPGSYAGAEGNFEGADEYVYDVGFRNPWRISFDVCTDNLWIADVGQYEWEEISVHPNGVGPSNFQWNIFEGTHGFSDACDSAGGNEIGPILDYPHSEGASITGGYVYRGSAIPALRGAYIFGDYASRTVWAARYEPGAATPVAKVELGIAVSVGIVAFAQDNRGEVYIAQEDGKILRIDAL